jgi:heavy metal sensor kinase
MKYKSLSFKLTLWYTVILAVMISLVGMFLYERFKDSLMDDLDRNLKEIADGLNKTYWRNKGVTWRNALNKTEEQFRTSRAFIQVIKIPDGKHVNSWEYIYSSNLRPGNFHLTEELYHAARNHDRGNPLYKTVNAEALCSFPMRTILMAGKSYVIIQVGLSLEKIIYAQRRLLIFLFLAGPLLLLTASLGGHLILRRALHLVRKVVQAANKISADDLSLRIQSEEPKDEIGELVNTFNQMIARLDGSINRIRQFSADASHELRTPLTIIRGEIEVILRKDREKEEYREILGSILEETQQMEHIIEDLLLLSSFRSLKTQMTMDHFSLDDMLRKETEKLYLFAGEKEIRLKLSKIEPVQFKGKRTLIERMVSNVIDNAIRYTQPGGTIDVALEPVETGARLTVSDTGIGIPDEALPCIYDRFYVVDRSRSKEYGGTGLGLSIVKWIADNHGITVNVQSRINDGTTFEFMFPCTAPAN